MAGFAVRAVDRRWPIDIAQTDVNGVLMKVFFDTMIFLHYRSLEELCLIDILGPPPHIVLVPRITLRELDKHKNTHSSSRIQERARKMLKKIERWAAGEEIRPGVSMEFLAGIPAVDYRKLGLNPDWSDDVLIASVLQYKADYPDDSSVALVTQDSGARIIASQLGVQVLELPEECKLPKEPDPLVAENRELLRKISALQNALPKLVVSFVGPEAPEHHATFVLPAPMDSMNDEIIHKIKEAKGKFPKQHPQQAAPLNKKSSVSLVQAQLVGLNIASISAEEYERYNRDVDEYLRSCERYIRAAWEIQAALRRTIRFKIEIGNTGTSPAQDVDVLLHFPDGFRLFSEEELQGLPYEIPEEPLPPQKPRTILQMMTDSIGPIHHLDFSPLPDFGMPSYNSFSIERTQGGYDVHEHFLSIKHGDRAVLPEMFLTFDSYESAGSFSCQYTIRPANVPTPITGDLHFVIERENANKTIGGDKK